MNQPNEYAVIVDRISHEVPYYRTYLKNAMLQGTHSRQQPIHVDGRRQIFRGVAGTKLGVASPKTVVLPNKEYVPGIVHGKSLRNLVFPMPWARFGGVRRRPCVLKDAHGGGWKEVYICHTMEELWHATTSLAC
jgi:hypothetical protein